MPAVAHTIIEANSCDIGNRTPEPDAMKHGIPKALKHV